jgi:hypothetical protein
MSAHVSTAMTQHHARITYAAAAHDMTSQHVKAPTSSHQDFICQLSHQKQYALQPCLQACTNCQCSTGHAPIVSNQAPVLSYLQYSCTMAIKTTRNKHTRSYW